MMESQITNTKEETVGQTDKRFERYGKFRVKLRQKWEIGCRVHRKLRCHRNLRWR
ncbi:hypothetical protein HanPI659440_Chr17g0697001 [Helianthus annuus]|nr:hypothetical protein HanPI659440_Chr17g0697001 [Helianthus annuus]